MSLDNSCADLMGHLRQGKEGAAARIFHRFGNRLGALARRRLERAGGRCGRDTAGGGLTLKALVRPLPATEMPMPTQERFASAESAFSDFSPEAWQRLEAILDDFEQAWQRGERPGIDDFLARAGGSAERQALLVELV